LDGPLLKYTGQKSECECGAPCWRRRLVRVLYMCCAVHGRCDAARRRGAGAFAGGVHYAGSHVRSHYQFPHAHVYHAPAAGVHARAAVYIRACACGLECDTTPLGPPMAVAPASICIHGGLGRTLMHTLAMAEASAQAHAGLGPCAGGPGGMAPARPSCRGGGAGIAVGLCTAGVGRIPLPATCPVSWLASGMGRRGMPLQMPMHGTVYASLIERSIHLSCYLI